MQRRYPIAWDCTTDEVREKIYNGMAEELDWTWKEIKRLRELFLSYGDHAIDCKCTRTKNGDDCDCGFTEALSLVEQLVPDKEA